MYTHTTEIRFISFSVNFKLFELKSVMLSVCVCTERFKWWESSIKMDNIHDQFHFGVGGYFAKDVLSGSASNFTVQFESTGLEIIVKANKLAHSELHDWASPLCPFAQIIYGGCICKPLFDCDNQGTYVSFVVLL